VFDALLRPGCQSGYRSDHRKRPNDGLKIAEEKPLPNEEAHLDSIIQSFDAQLRGL